MLVTAPSPQTKIRRARLEAALPLPPATGNFPLAAATPDSRGEDSGADMKTRAAVCRKFGAPLRIEEVELADPGPGEVRVKIAACAICHSDIYFLEGAWGGELPAVYGHEAAGVIESVGPGVTRLEVGDPVVATLIRSCGFGRACSEGAPVFCEEVFPLARRSPLTDHSGASIVHGMRIGALAQHVVVDASQVPLIPRDMPLDSAPLLACG